MKKTSSLKTTHLTSNSSTTPTFHLLQLSQTTPTTKSDLFTYVAVLLVQGTSCFYDAYEARAFAEDFVL